MTYGWALLIIALVSAAVVSLGLVDIGSFMGSRASGFAQITPVGWRVDTSGGFAIMLKNNAGADINITSINATLGTANITYTTMVPIANGEQTGQLSLGSFAGAPSSGSYTARVSISYVDAETGFMYRDSGTITGRVA